MSYSQSDVDIYVLGLFPEKFIGFYVDVGANDGTRLSCTRLFDDNNWYGMCIEPNPSIFPELDKTRHSINLNICISKNDNSEEDFLYFEKPDYNIFNGIQRTYENRNFSWINNLPDNQYRQLIKIKSRKLDNLLLEYGYSYVDYLKVDTEGCEFEILESIDFNRVNIDVLVVENPFRDMNIKNLLISKGYKLIKEFEYDQIYRK